MPQFEFKNDNEAYEFEQTVCATCGYRPVCMIITEALVQDPGDDGYPKELVLADNGTPTCIAYIERSN